MGGGGGGRGTARRGLSDFFLFFFVTKTPNLICFRSVGRAGGSGREFF